MSGDSNNPNRNERLWATTIVITGTVLILIAVVARIIGMFL